MNTYAQFWFDTEDFITPEADDALYELLLLFKAKGTKVTFKLVAEKARMLERRQRYDVIELLKEFDIGYHTEFHSMHPTIAEMCEEMNFSDGFNAFYQRENPGRLDVERITGRKCTCFGQPGNSWGSQTFPALRKMGIPLYMDSHDIISANHQPYWFGGMMNYLDICTDSNHRMPLEENGMDYVRENYDRWAKTDASGTVKFLNIYYHPCEYSCTEFYDLNFARGYNPPREKWRPSNLRGRTEMKKLVALMGDFVDFLVDEKGVKIISPAELMEMESSKTGEVPSDIVVNWAKKAAAGKVDFMCEDGWSLCAGECLSLAARYVLNKPLIPSFVYGPDKQAPSEIKCACGAAKSSAEAIYKFFDENFLYPYTQLPELFETENGAISPLDAAVIIANKIIGSDEAPHLANAILVPSDRVNTNDDWSSWPIHTEDFRATKTLALARQQMWTFKPALFS
jgi:hypothetical protein